MVNSRPHVILSAGMSLDGKIATRRGDSEFSSRRDKIRVHKLRTKVDAILVGSNTVKRDDPILTVRHAKGKNPLRIILDSRATINPKSNIIKTAKKFPTIIAVSKKAPRKNLAKLQKFQTKVVISGTNHVDIKKLLKILSKMKIEKILLEGGGTVNWQFVKQGLVDEVIVTITPYLVGGKNAVSLVDGKGYSSVTKSLKLKLHKTSRMGNELVLHYTN